MVVGILALVGLCAYGLTGSCRRSRSCSDGSSMKKIDASQGQIGGRGFAQAGFIMGIIGTIIFVIAVIAFIVFFVALFSTDCFADGCD
jgi:hypothetical protein